MRMPHMRRQRSKMSPWSEITNAPAPALDLKYYQSVYLRQLMAIKLAYRVFVHRAQQTIGDLTINVQVPFFKHGSTLIMSVFVSGIYSDLDLRVMVPFVRRIRMRPFKESLFDRFLPESH